MNFHIWPIGCDTMVPCFGIGKGVRLKILTEKYPSTWLPLKHKVTTCWYHYTGNLIRVDIL